MTKRIGLLGFQGCLEPHEQKFAALGAQTERVLEAAQLDKLDALVIPGGESSTMLKAAAPAFWQSLLQFGQQRPVWGICAGSILLARDVRNPHQPALGLIDMVIERNAYGAQNESFAATLSLQLSAAHQRAFLFIRAPRILSTGPDVHVLAQHDNAPVMVWNRQHLATTFHPELDTGTEIHAWFLEQLSQSG